MNRLSRQGLDLSSSLLGSNKSDPYIKSNILYEKVFNFELWFFAFRFKFYVSILYLILTTKIKGVTIYEI